MSDANYNRLCRVIGRLGVTMKLIIDISEADYTKLKDGRLPVNTMRKILLDGKLSTPQWVTDKQIKLVERRDSVEADN